MRNVNVGNKVWFVDSWTGSFHSGIVQSIEYMPDGTPYAKVLWDDLGTSGFLFSELFVDKQSLLVDVRKKSKENIENIRKGLHTAEDIIRYLYDNSVSGEDADWDGRKAVRLAAKDILGIDLEN